MTFYNTTNEVNPQLELFKKRTDKQDTLILAKFTSNPTREISPSILFCVDFASLGWPITSIRRSLTGLYQRGQIKRLGKQKSLISNVSEFVYVLNV